MSITDELRKYAPLCDEPTCKSLNVIADSIDAEYQKADDEWKAKCGQSWLHGYDECRAELMEGNEAIAACLEEAGWVQLPKDADGKPIAASDVLTDGKHTCTVTSIAFNSCNVVVYGCTEANKNEWPIDQTSKMHHVEPTVEDVLMECCKKYHSLLIEDMSDAIDSLERDHPAPSRVIAEYAEKLREVLRDE